MHRSLCIPQRAVVLLLATLSLTAGGETLRWNIKADFGMTADGIAKAVLAANSPDAVIEDNTLLGCPSQRSEGHELPKDPARLPE